MSIAALFQKSKDMETTQRPSADKWIKIQHIYTTGILLIPKERIMPAAATLMTLEVTILSEVSQRKTNTKYTYIWNLKQ